MHRHLPGRLPDDHAERATSRTCAARLDGAGASNLEQPLFVSGPLKQTGRVMVKDENVCLHCGLCAERCPTYAWDMRKFVLQIPLRGRDGDSADGGLSQLPAASCQRLEQFETAETRGATVTRCSSDSWKLVSWQLMTMDRINDFAFKIATANGTGSASANGLIMQAIFRMGVPVTGKNVFPSNIQGLPTWYEIRVSRHGYTARTPTLRPDGRAESGDLSEGRRRGAIRRLAAVRLDLAARRAADAARRHLPRHSARRDVQRARSRACASAS